MLYSI